MDIQVGEDEPNRVIFELFKNKVPLTAENFRCLCTGEKTIQDQNLHYKGSPFHRLIPKFMLQGGDFEKGNGTAGRSIYETRKFKDEKTWIPHVCGGLLSMANSGKDSNGSQFFITFSKADWLNGKHTVFGRVISGYDHVYKTQLIKTGANDKPLTPIKVVDCGEITEDIPESDLELELFNEPGQDVPEESKREI